MGESAVYGRAKKLGALKALVLAAIRELEQTGKAFKMPSSLEEGDGKLLCGAQ